MGLRPVEGWLTPDELAAASEAFISSSVAGILPVTRFNGHPIGAGLPGPWTRRARADREAVFGEGRGGVERGLEAMRHSLWATAWLTGRVTLTAPGTWRDSHI